jgi:hypothetical protein
VWVCVCSVVRWAQFERLWNGKGGKGLTREREVGPKSERKPCDTILIPIYNAQAQKLNYKQLL